MIKVRVRVRVIDCVRVWVSLVRVGGRVRLMFWLGLGLVIGLGFLGVWVRVGVWFGLGLGLMFGFWLG